MREVQRKNREDNGKEKFAAAPAMDRPGVARAA
jgi:hypothetical protein